MSWRRGQPDPTEDAQTLARVRGALEGYKASGANSVSIAHVLDLTNPRGLWKFDPQSEATERTVIPADADPMTGCLPVTAPVDSVQAGRDYIADRYGQPGYRNSLGLRSHHGLPL